MPPTFQPFASVLLLALPLNVARVVPAQPPSIAVVVPTGVSGGFSTMKASPSPPQPTVSKPFWMEPAVGKAVCWTHRMHCLQACRRARTGTIGGVHRCTCVGLKPRLPVHQHHTACIGDRTSVHSGWAHRGKLGIVRAWQEQWGQGMSLELQEGYRPIWVATRGPPPPAQRSVCALTLLGRHAAPVPT